MLTDAVTGDADTAPDSDPLTVVSAVQGTTTIAIGSEVTLAGGGTLKLNSDGSYTFNPGTAYNGLDAGETATESITYTVSDGNGGTDTATLTITINGANDTPVVIDPANPGTASNPIPATDPLNIVPDFSTNDGSALTPINVGNYVVDPDGEQLTFALDPATTPTWLAINPATGQITGTPPANASQLSNTGNPGEYLITITAKDPDGATVTTTVTLTITNLLPVAVDDTATPTEDAAVSGNVITDALSGDADTAPDPDPLTVVSAVQGTTAITIGSEVTLAGGGKLKLNSDGSYTFNPGTAYNGLDAGETATETITYTVSDGNGGTDTATLVITIGGVNDTPVMIDPANPGTPSNPIPASDPLNIIPDISANDGTAITPINVGNYVVDPDSEPLTFALDPVTTPSWLSIDPVTGQITGTPPANASQLTNTGTPGQYLITITAKDPDGAKVTTTVTVSVANLPPVAADDKASTVENGSVKINVLANDHDTAPDNDPLTVIAATAKNGTVVINADGTITYRPRPGFAGTDTITYVISDGNGGTSTATVKVSVRAQDYIAPPQSVASSGAGPSLGVSLPPSLQVSGAIVSSANGSSLGFSSAVFGSSDFLFIASQSLADGAIMSAADQADPLSGTNSSTGVMSLNGLPSLSGSSSILGTEIDRLDGIWSSVQRLVSSGAGAGGTWGPEGMTGFSLRYGGLGGSSTSELISIESLVRERALMINAQGIGHEAGKSVVEFRFLQANGRPLPSWLNEASDGFLIGERPSDVERLELRVIAVLEDGTVIEKDVVIDTMAGEIKPLETGRRTELPPMFYDQFEIRPKLTETEIETLARVLMDEAA